MTQVLWKRTTQHKIYLHHGNINFWESQESSMKDSLLKKWKPSGFKVHPALFKIIFHFIWNKKSVI